MVRWLGVVLLTGWSVCLAAEPTEAELRKRPAARGGDEAARLVQGWWQDGTAAGNVGDWYDNRDGDHSPLDLRPFPQLRKVSYSAEDVQARRHWAAQPRVLPHVTFGNSSTSAPPQRTGSNPRTLYHARDGLPLLHRQYRGNNLYIYPEHRDHDPGHNGMNDGYGDLFPTNTPYLLISQGSSGSDQPFMRALPLTLAAFRPEVKQKLVDNGLLMPTVQLILRRSMKGVAGRDDYLTGKAHPTVFEGANVDPVRMVKRAHALRVDSLPPLVQLKVVEEDEPTPLADYFEPPYLTERRGDTPSVVARVWRGHRQTRRLVVSAADSVDLNKRPLTFRWVLLRGDEKRVTIRPRDKDGRTAEITVAYHERRPIAAGSAMESNRVDIGVFADNGDHLSPPAFVTFFSLDSEARAYDDRGRIIEIGYGMGEIEPRLLRPADLLTELRKDGLAARLLRLTGAQREELGRVAATIAPLAARRDEAREQREADERVRAKAEADLRAREAAQRDSKGTAAEVATARAVLAQALKARDGSSKRLKEADDALARPLDERRGPLDGGTRAFVLRRLEVALATPTLWNEHVAALTGDAAPSRAAQARIDAARKKLVQLGIIGDHSDILQLGFRTAVTRNAPVAERLTRYERAMLAEFNAVVLGEWLPPRSMSFTFQANFVDARLSVAKRWRDVYRYDGDTLVGWTRYAAGGPADGVAFTADGWRVVEKDGKGRAIKARTVNYRQTAAAGARPPVSNVLEYADGPELLTLEYDAAGKRTVKGREKVDDKR